MEAGREKGRERVRKDFPVVRPGGGGAWAVYNQNSNMPGERAGGTVSNVVPPDVVSFARCAKHGNVGAWVVLAASAVVLGVATTEIPKRELLASCVRDALLLALQRRRCSVVHHKVVVARRGLCGSRPKLCQDRRTQGGRPYHWLQSVHDIAPNNNGRTGIQHMSPLPGPGVVGAERALHKQHRSRCAAGDRPKIIGALHG